MTKGLIGPTVLFLLVVGACDPATVPSVGSASSVATVRDIAGITLVDN